MTLGFVMSFSGGLAAVLLAFVLPPAAWVKNHTYSICLWRNKGHVIASAWQLGPALIMLAFGLSAAVLCSVQSVACEFGGKDVQNTVC